MTGLLRNRHLVETIATSPFGMRSPQDHVPTIRVDLCGDLDVSIASDLRTRLRSIMDEGYLVIELDLSRVGFIDSTALGVLFGAHCRLKVRGGELRVIATTPVVARVLQVTGLDRSLGSRDGHTTVTTPSHA